MQPSNGSKRIRLGRSRSPKRSKNAMRELGLHLRAWPAGHVSVQVSWFQSQHSNKLAVPVSDVRREGSDKEHLEDLDSIVTAVWRL